MAGKEEYYGTPDRPYLGEDMINADPIPKSAGTVATWADPAMYEQDPIDATDGPKVHLLWMTPDPLGAMAAMNGMYPGPHHVVPKSLGDISRSAREAVLEDMRKTVLVTPMEAVQFHFVIEGVTRAFTHQLVRNRNSAYAQESMRFAVSGSAQNEIPVALPPSLVRRQEGMSVENFASGREIWWRTVEHIDQTYKDLVSLGFPAEDARGILPTNILTRIEWNCNLRSLQGELGKRLSTQAQFEWRAVIAQIAQAIRTYDPYASLKSMFADEMQDHMKPDAAEGMRVTADYLASHDRWQYEAISDLFRPICYSTGKCEFMASADRHCTIRDRVEANHQVGRSSSEWHLPFTVAQEAARVYPDSYLANPEVGDQVVIPPIHPHEWLSDPTAARPE